MKAIQNALWKRSTDYKDVPAPVLAQLESVAAQHGMDARTIAHSLAKFMATSGRGSSNGVTCEDVEALAEHLSTQSRGPAPLSAARTDNLFDRGLSFEDATLAALLEGNAGSRASASQRISPYLSKQAAAAPKPRTPASSGKFKERAQRGEVVSVLNPHVDPPAERMEVEGEQSCSVEVLGVPLPPGAKYMVNRIEDKVEHQEGRINALEDALEARGLDVHSVSQAAQDQALFVGRICCDTEEGRLNPQSTLLEGSIRQSQGARVRLDLSKCPAFRLFPGQVVAVKGANPSGSCIVVAEVVGGLPLPMPRSSLQQLAEYASATGKRGLSVVVAAGPYSTSEDCEYEPLQALLEYCAQHKPDALLLLGPFVDVEHPLVQTGLLEETFEEVFQSRVLDQLSAFSSSNSSCRVMLVPSVRDAHHHPVFPQPPLHVQQPASLQSLPGPATVRCNEVVFGCTSTDWLMACTSQEISRTVAQTDRLSALATHVVSQANYMPMYPPPPSLPLDSSSCAALELPCTPDVLVLPSDLQPFAKLVPVPQHSLAAAGAEAADAGASPMETDGAAAAAAGPGDKDSSFVCINPGRLAKGVTGGTFAHVYIPPLKEALDVLSGEPPATNAAVQHQVDRRCRVEIRRV